MRCVELLIVAGSSIHARDLHGDTTIQIAVWANDRPPMLETLHLAESALEDQNKNGVMALQCTVDLNHHRNVAYLLEIGANLESRGNMTTPHFSMRSGTATLSRFEVLLRYKPRFDYTNKTRQTALHIAAMEGDLRVLQLLTTASMEGLDPRVQDSKGRSTYVRDIGRSGQATG